MHEHHFAWEKRWVCWPVADWLEAEFSDRGSSIASSVLRIALLPKLTYLLRLFKFFRRRTLLPTTTSQKKNLHFLRFPSTFFLWQPGTRPTHRRAAACRYNLARRACPRASACTHIISWVDFIIVIIVHGPDHVLCSHAVFFSGVKFVVLIIFAVHYIGCLWCAPSIDTFHVPAKTPTENREELSSIAHCLRTGKHTTIYSAQVPSSRSTRP